MRNDRSSHVELGTNRPCSRVWLSLFTAALVFALPLAASAQSVSMNAVEAAILEENWKLVAELLKSVSDDVQKSRDPVLRLIKGHACLALNRNNESVCLFLSVAAPENLKKCRAWAAGFATRNPQSSISHYFHGDVLARLDRWSEALASFEAALRMRYNHAMALNAYGTTLCAVGKWDDALVHLTQATLADENFADAHASLGAMWIQRRSGPDGACNSYARVLELAPKSTLALNGAACAQFAFGHWTQANKTFADAADVLPADSKFGLVIDHNLTILTVAMKRAQFPFFSRYDLIRWDAIRRELHQPQSILYAYFAHIRLGEKPDDRVVQRFNEVLEIPDFYDRHQAQIDRILESFGAKKGVQEARKLLGETVTARQSDFDALSEADKEKIRKLNRLILECLLPDKVLQLAMSQLDAPGMSLERGAGLVNSWEHKQGLSNAALQSGINRMHNYRGMADAVSGIPFLSGVGEGWRNHLDNQIGINGDILRQRNITPSRSGGVDLNLRNARVLGDDWGVVALFGLGYHVAPRNPDSNDNERFEK